MAIVEGWLFVEQGSALRKIEGCAAYDLYEKSEIFQLPRSKSWAPGATGLLEHSLGGGLCRIPYSFDYKPSDFYTN